MNIEVVAIRLADPADVGPINEVLAKERGVASLLAIVAVEGTVYAYMGVGAAKKGKGD